jgi:hypothetical protein
VFVPIDDTDPILTYTGSWTSSTSPEWYLATVAKGDQDAQLTLTFTGSGFCLLRGPTTGPAAAISYLIVPAATGIGGVGGSIPEDGTTPIGERPCYGDREDRDTYTLTLTVTSAEPFVLDGLILF